MNEDEKPDASKILAEIMPEEVLTSREYYHNWDDVELWRIVRLMGLYEIRSEGVLLWSGWERPSGQFADAVFKKSTGVRDIDTLT